MKTTTLLLPILIGLLVVARQSNGSSAVAEEAPCPLFDLPYPRPEPAYNGKLELDFSPFATALGAYTPEQMTAREILVSGKTIPELQTLLDNGDLTSVDLVIYYLERIHRHDVDRLNAVLELNPKVLEIAQMLDDERAADAARGPMHGIPVLLKDNIAAGDQLRTAAGAAAMLGWKPDRDAFLVSQLRNAGAIILGKTNLSEWANYMDSCMPNGFSTNGGQTQNPYGRFETYGSSSGSAVAVAADLATASVGTETQGSLILPASINSVVALKTSKGLVSGDYIIPLLPWQDVPGPMGRTVTDVAALLSAMTGVDPNDPGTSSSAGLSQTEFARFLTPEAKEGLRVGIPVWSEDAFVALFEKEGITDEEQQASIRAAFVAGNDAVRATGEILSRAGLPVVEVPRTALPDRLNVAPTLEVGFKQAINAFLAGLGDDAPVGTLKDIIAFNNGDQTNRAPYGQDHLEASQNTAVTAEKHASLRRNNQQAARNGINHLLSRFDIDVIVSDLSQIYAPAGYPALTVPAGYGADGAPQGTVFVGGFLSEPKLLAVGYAYEQATRARVAPDLEATMKLIEAMGESSP